MTKRNNGVIIVIPDCPFATDQKVGGSNPLTHAVICVCACFMDAYTHILVEAAGKPWVRGILWQEEIRLSEIMYKDRPNAIEHSEIQSVKKLLYCITLNPA